MRKTLTLLLTTLLALTLAGCHAVSPKGDDPDTAATTSSSSSEGNAGTSASSSASPTINKTVLVDEDDYTIVAKRLDPDTYGGPSIVLRIENKSDRILQFQPRDVSVNGYMVHAFLSTKVSPGKKRSDKLVLEAESLKLAGIEQLAVIDISFVVLDEEWNELATTATSTLKTSLARSFEALDNSSDKVLYDDNGVTIYQRELRKAEGVYGPRMVFEIVNAREESVTIMAESTTVNGSAIEPYFYCEISPDRRIVTAMEFSGNSLSANDIKDIERLETTLVIYPQDGWEPLATSGPLSLTF